MDSKKVKKFLNKNKWYIIGVIAFFLLLLVIFRTNMIFKKEQVDIQTGVNTDEIKTLKGYTHIDDLLENDSLKFHTHIQDLVMDRQEIDGQEIDEQEIDEQEIDEQEIDEQEMDGQEIDGQEMDEQEIDEQEMDGQEMDGQEIDGQVEDTYMPLYPHDYKSDQPLYPSDQQLYPSDQQSYPSDQPYKPTEDSKAEQPKPTKYASCVSPYEVEDSFVSVDDLYKMLHSKPKVVGTWDNKKPRYPFAYPKLKKLGSRKANLKKKLMNDDIYRGKLVYYA